MDMGFFLAILFVVAAIMRVDFFFYIFYFFAGVYFISRFWVRRALAQVRIERHLPSHAFWGDKALVQIEIENDGLLPVPWLQLQESLPQPLAYPVVRSHALSLWPREKTSVSYELDCRKRGYYSVGPLRLSSGDFLGSDGRVMAEIGVSHLTVYPRLLPLEDIAIPSRSPYGNIKRSDAIHRDVSKIAGVREYQPGDSIRHVNWKASAAVGALQSKIFDPVISLDTMVFLDLEREHYEASYAVTTTELAISVAASAVDRLAKRRQPFGLSSNGADPLSGNGGVGPSLPIKSGQAHLMAVLEALGRIETRAAEPFGSLLRHEVLKLPWGCTVFMITGTGEELLGHVLRLRKSGFRVLTILVDYHADTRRVAEELERAGATVYRVSAAQELARLVV